jgi:hypothetical protein
MFRSVTSSILMQKFGAGEGRAVTCASQHDGQVAATLWGLVRPTYLGARHNDPTTLQLATQLTAKVSAGGGHATAEMIGLTKRLRRLMITLHCRALIPQALPFPNKRCGLLSQ